MGIADFVAITVSLSSSQSPTRQGFGVPLLCAFLSANAVTHNPARFRVYSSGTALTQMVTDGFLTTDPAYRAMQVALAAPNVPPQIALGRRTLAMTQVLKMTFTSAVAGDLYQVTVIGSDGVSHTYTLTSTGVVNTDAASFAALMTATNIGTVTVTTATVTITQASGKLTDLQLWTTNLSIADTTTDPGIATDIAAILAVNTIGWYGFSLDSNSKAEIVAAQATIEATGVGGKFAFYNNSDLANCTAGSGDLDSTLQASGYNKCWLTQSNKQVLCYAGFGLASQVLALSPGAWAGAFKAIPGVLADDDTSLTETQRLVLNTASTSSPGTGGKGGNWYATVSGLNVTFPGVAPGGKWVDTTIGIDWLQANMQADVFAVMASFNKIPYTDFGIGLIGGAIESRLKTASRAPFGLIDGTRPITVTVPPAASVSLTDKNNRNLSGLSAQAFIQGAIITTEIGVTLTP